MWDLSLSSVLHPIVDARTGHVIGHEALLRGPRGTRWESPQVLFDEAEHRGARAALETRARQLAVSRLADLPPEQVLFVNIDPIVPPAQPPIPAPPDRVVLAITETRSVVDDRSLLTQISAWRSQGHRIAIDDYGAGYMGLGALLAIQPDLVKIDRSIIGGIAQDAARRASVEAVVHVATAMGTLVVAEGVETPEEFWTVRACGVHYVQGYLFGKPSETPVLGPIELPEPWNSPPRG